MNVRAARDADGAVLGQHGLSPGSGRSVFVVEDDGVIGGAMTVSPQPFDSEMLGLQVGRIDTIATWSDDEALVRLIGGALKQLRGAGYALLSCRRPETERTVIATLQATGFRVVECLLTLGRPLDGLAANMPHNVTTAQADDADACAAIARQTFRYDRYHADPQVSDKAADTLKATWAANEVRGRADTVFVTGGGSTLSGFNACLLNDDTATIDLIGVAPEHQGRGLGGALTDAALAHYTGKAKRLTVGTQSCNVGSLALYQSRGFRVETSAFTLHAHLG